MPNLLSVKHFPLFFFSFNKNNCIFKIFSLFFFFVFVFSPLTIDLNQSAYEPAKSAIQGRQSILSRIDLDKWRSSTKIEALLEELTILTEKDELTKVFFFDLQKR